MNLKFTQQFLYLGSSYLSPANELGGSRATLLFFLSFPKAAAAPALRALKQAGKKEGGWGEGIFARWAGFNPQNPEGFAQKKFEHQSKNTAFVEN